MADDVEKPDLATRPAELRGNAVRLLAASR